MLSNAIRGGLHHLIKRASSWQRAPRAPFSTSAVDLADVTKSLRDRGLVYQSTPELDTHLRSGRRTVYAGFDPTADCLHLGNLLIIMTLMHFQRAGHNVVALVGGATGLIGDPSGKNTERQLLHPDDVERNVEGIRGILEKFLMAPHSIADAMGQSSDRHLQIVSKPGSVQIVNNRDWYNNMSIIEFLRDVGKSFRIGPMLARDSVKNRLQSAEGLSFTEFSYQVLQGHDFYHLYRQTGCTVQVGGSDQWGNITAGIEYVQKRGNTQSAPQATSASEVHGMTVPLLTTSTGEKFGKSAGNALWLDGEKTSPYTLYQFLLQVPDADVEKLLMNLTFLQVPYIQAVMAEHMENPELRKAQKCLAEEVLKIVHGERGLSIAQQATALLFPSSQSTVDGTKGSSSHKITASEFLLALKGVPLVEIPREKALSMSLIDLAVASKLVDSKNAARRLVQSGGLYVANEKVTDGMAKLTPQQIHLDSVVLLRQGARKQHVISLIDSSSGTSQRV